ncbi:uncharacterized protein EV420DRAFT_1635544 [Desarmillaria tabescens]|uniref:DUF1640-domain-containing protein n=1 Tax=Armillaria tabescens TaxID=1929756 RepID=A0AA39NMC0_ARMTA|nr:uncharacterized protein EV420DRAFT_1635544 [Desarmillaria tabescens]KAK0468294.1 hypothetical protein EV420DRAFT_1635544 [Desarmillaria tabescens]
MIVRQLPRLCRSLSTEVYHLPSPSTSIIPLVAREVETQPIPNGARSISLAHPKDPAAQLPHSLSDSLSSSKSQPPPPPPPTTTPTMDSALSQVESPSVPSKVESKGPVYSQPPFHTHAFFTVLEKTFPTPTARGLMRATRALLVDRVGRVRREGLTAKTWTMYVAQAYLFRAALSELRSEITMTTKNDVTAMKTSGTVLRREVDKLDVKMKEDLGFLKHEIQMELDSRKNEVKEQFKRQDISVEEMLNKFIVEISTLRTVVEEVKWDNTRRAVLTLFGFVAVILTFMELRPKPPPTPPAPSSRQQVHIPPPRSPNPVYETGDGLEKIDWVT